MAELHRLRGLFVDGLDEDDGGVFGGTDAAGGEFLRGAGAGGVFVFVKVGGVGVWVEGRGCGIHEWAGDDDWEIGPFVTGFSLSSPHFYLKCV